MKKPRLAGPPAAGFDIRTPTNQGETPSAECPASIFRRERMPVCPLSDSGAKKFSFFGRHGSGEREAELAPTNGGFRSPHPDRFDHQGDQREAAQKGGAAHQRQQQSVVEHGCTIRPGCVPSRSAFGSYMEPVNIERDKSPHCRSLTSGQVTTLKTGKPLDELTARNSCARRRYDQPTPARRLLWVKPGPTSYRAHVSSRQVQTWPPARARHVHAARAPRWLIELRGPHPPEPLLLLHKFTLGYTSPLPQPPERIPQLTSGRLWGCQRPSVRTDFEGGRQLPTSASVCRGAARSERALQVHEPRESPAAITTQPLVSAANTAVAIGSA
jgi:hypothetical protein